MPDKSVVETLKAARELISVPERWTQGESARGKTGRKVDFRGPYAVCWCSSGAVYKIGGPCTSMANRYMDRATGGDYVTFNDTHTHPEVLAAFDKAIELAEKDHV